MKITMHEIETAIAAAAPAEGEGWDHERVAASIAKLITSEAAAERADRDAWEAGRSEFSVRFNPTPSPAGSAESVSAMQAAAVEQHRAAVQERIRRNRQLVGGIQAAVVTVGTGVLSGGLSNEAAMTALLGIAGQITDAINDRSV